MQKALHPDSEDWGGDLIGIGLLKQACFSHDGVDSGAAVPRLAHPDWLPMRPVNTIGATKPLFELG